MSLLPRLRGQDGMSVAEMLIASAITASVGMMLITSLFSVVKTEEYTGQDSAALATTRVALDRLEEELRQARKLYTESASTRLAFWVDLDEDNQQDKLERITWDLEDTGGGRASLMRWVEDHPVTPTKTLVAEGLTSGAAFVFNEAPPKTRVVSITLQIDGGDRTPVRTMKTKVTLRNVG